MKRYIQAWNKVSLIKRIVIGVVIGLALALVVPSWSAIGILGDVFVGALRAVAPLLVFTLVTNALSKQKEGKKSNMKTIVVLYLFGTFAAALVAVIASFMFPTTLTLANAATDIAPPSGLAEVARNLLLNIVENPVSAIANGNYIGILAWASLFGMAMRKASQKSKDLLETVADVTSTVVAWVINLAPFGILGLVFKSISDQGIEALLGYGQLVLVIVATNLFVALIINPIIGFVMMRKNPYPLVLKTLRISGVTAFFTRSSAANIPVNLQLSEELGLDPDTYNISIPLGATINMGGAAITITILSLAAVHTLGIPVDFGTALLLSLVAALSAAGASGVTGGSLLLIPVACSLFGISGDISAQVIGVGFIIGLIQDPCETALNSSTDVLYTAYAEWNAWRKNS
ncbi:serine/threonine transporter SstT [Streptococcus danieliae]|uniref:Serine/threonine transporter SstT n=1 Tax=Streptococcus danieliae TaxID=747656 RepID=A0A7Z0S555_9STRE|nr:serine/threonine transporter SstT [Streptococcus danieliae]MBF0699561.1 serine/threonine transporter SstT [Streptococcus danieliae]NYS96737.1 serine/threonine transporter SstT [Streptococcus danieliae]